MVVRLILDENISPAAAVVLATGGVDAWHVRDRGLEGTSDGALLDRAYQEDRILVTLNVGDFEKLVRVGTLLREQNGEIVQRQHGVLEIRECEGSSAFLIEIPALTETPPKNQRIRYDSRMRYL